MTQILLKRKQANNLGSNPTRYGVFLTEHGLSQPSNFQYQSPNTSLWHKACWQGHKNQRLWYGICFYFSDNFKENIDSVKDSDGFFNHLSASRASLHTFWCRNGIATSGHHHHQSQSSVPLTTTVPEQSRIFIYEPHHEKTCLRGFRPGKTQTELQRLVRVLASSGIILSRQQTTMALIRVFAVRMKKQWVLSYPLSTLWRLIRLDGCPGWTESSLGEQTILLALSWGGSIVEHHCYDDV